MSVYAKQLQQIIFDYRQDGQKWPATTKEISQWALKVGRYDVRVSTLEKLLARDLAQAMREEFITDSKGRRIRAKHSVKTMEGGKQIMLWDDIRTAPRDHMLRAFQFRRNHIIGECRQIKADVDGYNEAHSTYKPIQMPLNFTKDVEELENLKKVNKFEEITKEKSIPNTVGVQSPQYLSNPN